jgi:hypothetical protein
MNRPSYPSGAIERALDVLREATGTRGKMQTRGVRLALFVLRQRCPDDTLKWFWEAAGTDNDIGRSQNMHAAFNRIVRLVSAGR